MSDWQHNCSEIDDDEEGPIVYPYKRKGKYMKVPKSKTNGIYS